MHRMVELRHLWWEHAKHIDILKHFAHEAVRNGHMRLYKIPTEFQLVELLTKSLQRGQFELNLSSLHRYLVSPVGKLERLRDLGLRRGVRPRPQVGVTSGLRRGVWACVGWKARMDVNSRSGVRDSELEGSTGPGLGQRTQTKSR